jgi:amidase
MAESGLPVGVQLVAPPFDEPTLIRVGSQLEDVFQWQDRQAPM